MITDQKQNKIKEGRKYFHFSFECYVHNIDAKFSLLSTLTAGNRHLTRRGQKLIWNIKKNVNETTVKSILIPKVIKFAKISLNIIFITFP
jgi:hypothetical protein